MWSLKFSVADTHIPCSSQMDHSEMEAATDPPGLAVKELKETRHTDLNCINIF